MDSDLINISLNQGKQFKNYQGKIKSSVQKSQRIYKKREGFTTQLPINDTENTDNLLQKRDDRAKSISQANQADLNQLTNLQAQYADLQSQYTDAQKNMNDNSLVSINRISSKNPYLNKNIRFTTGHVCYVTNLGIVKWIPSNEIWDTLKNCSDKTYIDVNIPWLSEYGTPGATIPTNPSLISGTNMVANQACGNEGKNVYVSKLITSPSSSYVGCYNDNPAATMVNGIPIMNSSNNVNGFTSNASSVYISNGVPANSTVGAWAAFDQNSDTYWHTAYDNSSKYNAANGIYQGTHQVIFTSKSAGLLTVKGEFLQINMPGVNTASVKNIKVTQYSIAPRKDNNLFLQRSPNTWYLLGYKIDPVDSQGKWYEVDYQEKQNFISDTPRTFPVEKPEDYGAYIILTTVVGNNDQTTIRDCLQIAELNLFVSSSGTFSDTDRSMIYNYSAIGYTTYSECEKYAVNNNYQYFGLQDLQANGTAQCVVSNDYDKTIGYGNASDQVTAILLWSSNTQSGGQSYVMQVVGTGQIIIYNNDFSAEIFTSGEANPDCGGWGTITINSATYGGNCSSSSVPIGNVTDKVSGGDIMCNWKENCSIPISNNTFGDPAPGCEKSFDVAYKCGGSAFTRNLNPAEGQTMILDCKDYMLTTCQYVFILQDDGDMCLYKGKDPSTKTDLIWSSGTKGMQKSANSNWAASKGKYGRNYMKTGEVLVADEWIGSNDGSIKLIMQIDGNLVLYTSETKLGCSVKDNKTFGSGRVNAVYKIDPVGNKASLGKVAYIDGESQSKEYPSSLLSYSNQYDLLSNFDSTGNDIQQIETTTKEQGCLDACNANGDCAGFVYQPNGNLCYLKSSAMYPAGEKQFYANSGLIMGVRKPQISSSFNGSCSKTIVDVDTIQYDQYIKGDPMTSETICGSSVVYNQDKSNLTNLQNQMLSVGKQISTETNNLYTTNNDLYNTMSQNSAQFNKNVDMYKKNDNKIKSELNLPGKFQRNNNNNVNKREGMRSIDMPPEKILTMNDINSMLSDTDIRVLQENYSYIFWSILAVGLLTITVSQIKK
jgi:hypothetical protein